VQNYANSAAKNSLVAPRTGVIWMADQPVQGSTESDPRKAEMIRDTAPHPEDLIFNSEGYEFIEKGRWRFEIPIEGWYEDVVNSLWVEGFQIWRIRGDEPELITDRMKVDIVEDVWHKYTTCPRCGEYHQGFVDGEGLVPCPSCGLDPEEWGGGG
jgi:hypothetical protein